MYQTKRIFKSFSLKPSLNPKIWLNPNEPTESKIKGEVRKGLLKIAEEFVDFLDSDVFVNDIILTGSLSNYNWSEFSDFDLHILVDFTQFEKQSEIYKELFDLKKQLFNKNHNIKIFGYDVELYVEDENETRTPAAVYSILNDEWVNVPKKEKLEISKTTLKKKIKSWIDKIETVIEDEDYKGIQNLKKKIKEYRQCGLRQNGEFSYENLVFKFLRRSDLIEKLNQKYNELLDKSLSIESKLVEASSMNSELLGGNSVKIPRDGAHAGQKGWQSYNAWDIPASVGTPVYSLTSGVVATWTDYGDRVIKTQGKKLYGQSFRIKSDDGIPQIYYTHLKSSNVRKGDRVECGQILGYIMDFPNSPYDHVHIGIEPPGNIRDFLNSDGSLKCAKGIFLGGYQQDPVDQIIDRNQFIQDIKDIALKGKTYGFERGRRIVYDKDVENIQIALQFLGFSLPQWGVDGLFGPETERATKDFERKYSLIEDGKMNQEDLKYLTASLVDEDFVQSDLQDIQKEKEDYSNLS